MIGSAWPAVLSSLLLSGCQSKEEDSAVLQPEAVPPLSEELLVALTPERLRDHVDFLAADETGGRIPGSPGHRYARDYLEEQMEQLGLEPLGADSSYLQAFPGAPVEGRLMIDEEGVIVPHAVEEGTNLVGMIPGSDPELADEVIVIMAHYDHLGVDELGDPYNGAFDNATGVAVALELARVFLQPEAALPRSLMILLSDEEESGLDGARALLEAALIPTERIVAGISVDPVGRPLLPDYWPIVMIGAERSPEFKQILQEAETWADPEIDVVFMHRDVIPVFASDQDTFYEHEDPIPAVWFTNPGFSFYHTVDDSAETIDYRVLWGTSRYLAQATALLGSDTLRYAYEGSPPLDGQVATDALELFDGLASSEVLSGSDRDWVEYFAGELEKVEETNDVSVLGSTEGFFFAATYFVMFELGWAYPGEIPPPFPGDEDAR